MKKAALMLRERIVLLTGHGVALAENRTRVSRCRARRRSTGGASHDATAFLDSSTRPTRADPAPWIGKG
jgi:hypothetical protein